MKTSDIKKYKKILVISLLAIAAIYVIYHIAYSLRPEAEFFSVRPYTAKDSQVFTGYIFREETVMTAYTGGMCHYHYYDGEKVPANHVVADVYRYGNESVAAQLRDIKDRIEILRRSMSLGRLTKAEVEQKIELVSYEITRKNAEGDTAAADALGDELLVLMAKKDLLTDHKSDYNAEIALLESRSAALAASLGTPAESVMTQRSGYFYSETDGYETIFTADAVKRLDLESFDALTSMSPIKQTGAVGKLLTSAKWHFATKVSEKDAEGFLAGTTYHCLFLDNSYTETIPMKLISKESNGTETLLIFFASSLPRDFDITRTQRIEAIRSSYEGFRIPEEAVRAENGYTYVYVFDNGTAEKREVNILWEQNGYYIVSEHFERKSEYAAMKLNDLVIINDTKLYEGKFID